MAMERNLRKTRAGVVVSDKMDKTIVVAVKDSVQHPLYKKIMKRTVKDVYKRQVQYLSNAPRKNLRRRNKWQSRRKSGFV